MLLNESLVRQTILISGQAPQESLVYHFLLNSKSPPWRFSIQTKLTSLRTQKGLDSDATHKVPLPSYTSSKQTPQLGKGDHPLAVMPASVVESSMVGGFVSCYTCSSGRFGNRCLWFIHTRRSHPSPIFRYVTAILVGLSSWAWRILSLFWHYGPMWSEGATVHISPSPSTQSAEFFSVLTIIWLLPLFPSFSFFKSVPYAS